MSTAKTRPFGVKDQLGYIFGDMAGSFVNLYVDAYFLTFCTYVLGIDPKWMASLFLFARLWDAFNDPMMGSFPDRWHIGKTSDKFKPWIKLFMIPLALSGVLCFLPVPFEGVALHFFVAFAYVFYGMSYTGTSMPFGAMANVVSADPIDRSKLSRARSIGGTIVGIGAISIVPILCFDKNSNILPERFTIVAVVFGLLSLLCYTLLNKLTLERIHDEPKKEEKFKYSEVIKAALHNRPLIGVMIATIGSMLMITGGGQLNTFMYKEVYHNTSMMTIAALANLPVIAIMFPLVPWLVKRFSKRNILLAGALVGLVINLIPIIFPIKDVLVFTIIRILGNIPQGIFTMLIWALVADCLDYSEWKQNVRSDGSMYSLYTFSRKIGSTIASTGVASALSIIGFVQGANVVQSATTVSNLYLLGCGVPIATCVLELIGLGLIFNMDKNMTNTMYKELADKRAAANA